MVVTASRTFQQGLKRRGPGGRSVGGTVAGGKQYLAPPGGGHGNLHFQQGSEQRVASTDYPARVEKNNETDYRFNHCFYGRFND